jgi:hypothetical protein
VTFGGVDLPEVDLAYFEVGAVVWVLLSVGMYALSQRASPPVVLFWGLVYEVVLCMDTAALEAMLFRFGEPPVRLSFIVVPLISFPLVVPATFQRRLLTTLLDLAALVIGVSLGRYLAGLPTLDPVMLMPTALVSFAAIALSRVMRKMALRVSEAEELGSYQLVERLGGGGMGEVWRARHRLLIRPAAVKVVRPDTLEAQRSTALARFEREAQATSALQSPHTVHLYDFGRTEDGAFFYAMELLDGMDLQQLVEEFGPQPADRVRHILHGAAESLAEAHAKGLVHRDVKPSNVFLARVGLEFDFVKVLDFGLVKSSEGTGQESMVTRADAAPGTPAYLSPEQARGEPVDGRSDLYGLGCVAYWLLTGELVFDAGSELEMAVAHLRDDPEPPSTRSELPIPPVLDELVLALLAKAPQERPKDALEVMRRLEAMDDELPWSNDRAAAWWKTHAPQAVPTLRPPAR